VTDAAVLSALVNGGVILVVAVGQADKNIVKRACSLLTKANARILGVVVNREQVKRAYEYYYYYQSKGERNAL
jgi:Mrp family chromosome partitioning ATPase